MKQALSDKFVELEDNDNFILEATKTSILKLEEKMNLTLKNFEEIIRDIKLDIDYNLKGSITNAIEKVERFEMDPLMNASTLLFDFSKEGSNESISQFSNFLHRVNF